MTVIFRLDTTKNGLCTRTLRDIPVLRLVHVVQETPAMATMTSKLAETHVIFAESAFVVGVGRQKRV